MLCSRKLLFLQWKLSLPLNNFIFSSHHQLYRDHNKPQDSLVEVVFCREDVSVPRVVRSGSSVRLSIEDEVVYFTPW